MNRREYVSTLATTTLSIGVLQNKESSDKNSESNWCITTPEKESTLAFPDTDPDFTVLGSKNVDVYWKSQDFFDARGYFFADAVANVGGNIIALNKGNSQYIDDYVMLHELAHSLGYRHGDGGIVNTNVALFKDNGDRSGDTLQSPTKDVGKSFDAYNLYTEWDVETLGELGASFAQNNLLVSELGEAGKRFASNNSIEDIHIKNSHNGFGGIHDTTIKSNPTNVYAGHFYKSA